MSAFESNAADMLAPAITANAGESVTYTQSGEAAAVILAVVHRDPLQSIPTDPNRIDYPIRIQVSRADVPVVIAGRDSVALKKRISDSSTTLYNVAKVLGQDGGMWVLGLN